MKKGSELSNGEQGVIRDVVYLGWPVELSYMGIIAIDQREKDTYAH